MSKLTSFVISICAEQIMFWLILSKYKDVIMSER